MGSIRQCQCPVVRFDCAGDQAKISVRASPFSRDLEKYDFCYDSFQNSLALETLPLYACVFLFFQRYACLLIIIGIGSTNCVYVTNLLIFFDLSTAGLRRPEPCITQL